MNGILVLVLSLLALLLPGCSSAKRTSVLRLAVTTSTQDSGLLDVLIPVFEEKHGMRVDVIAVGTGAALRLGEAGDVDVVLVHAKEPEDAFIAAGHGIRREAVMYNRFEILGPNDDPAGIHELGPAAALSKIAAREQVFVSRGDDSGTHQREKKIWAEAGRRPDWQGYVESGQGMGATLTMADQLNAYVLSDRGTYLRFRKKLRIVPLVTSSVGLRNVYGIMVVNPKKHPSINGSLSHKFVDFVVSVEAQKLIRDFKIEGEQLFCPLRLPAEA